MKGSESVRRWGSSGSVVIGLRGGHDNGKRDSALHRLNGSDIMPSLFPVDSHARISSCHAWLFELRLSLQMIAVCGTRTG
jgi:hypothetical protein